MQAASTQESNAPALLPVPPSLEVLRSRIQQITASLQTLHMRIAQSDPHALPPWPQVQSALTVLLTQLSSALQTLHASRAGQDAIRAISVFPGRTFPVAQQEGLLQTLLRTKPLPSAEAYVQLAQEHGISIQAEHKITQPQLVSFAREGEDVPDYLKDEAIPADAWFTLQRAKRSWTGFYTQKEQDEDFEIDVDDLDDIRKERRLEQEKCDAGMKAMLSFMRRGG
ncbi:mediator of RNA polymerase II transcription complex subunit 8-domain-containing protein [Protomyces lactucae-debilis]|uniref:Mediator of RNA polymerase II transcription subunit 8 n=1 Tax=Protomyces lactucae-debilis TaxID=2754530 RepID=A0A1Y2FSH9_PROLT|nr:mediator of RNA polymerase II transcription complex subunit 8-domain-containing protein [Protomyces lactucae-debilis]ORY86264.1 mediator of RNA polymerase II transcription complex subunit 8-domain-containing protein [Protomyces lactucae-debilis]